jgi:hypothetical protein
VTRSEVILEFYWAWYDFSPCTNLLHITSPATCMSLQRRAPANMQGIALVCFCSRKFARTLVPDGQCASCSRTASTLSSTLRAVSVSSKPHPLDSCSGIHRASTSSQAARRSATIGDAVLHAAPPADMSSSLDGSVAHELLWRLGLLWSRLRGTR